VALANRMEGTGVSLSLVHSAEHAICGSLLQEPHRIPQVRALLPANAFSEDSCRLVYRAILEVHEEGEKVTFLTIAERLEQTEQLGIVGGISALQDMVEGAVAPSNVMSHARIVIRHFQRGKLARMGERVLELADQAGADPATIVQMAATYARDIVGAGAQSQCLIDIQQLQERHEAQKWAVKGMIPQNSLGMLFGASGTFKSFVALDYALHRAYGLPWLGRRTQKGTPVYLAAEGGAGLMRRVHAWHKQRGMDWTKCPMRFVIVPMQLMEQAAELRQAIEATGITLSDIIVDTMSQTFSGEENSSTDVAKYLSTIGAELRAPFGATVLVVHHVGHVVSERPRGSSAIQANCDFLFGCYRDEKEMVATLECVKQKDGERPAPVSFALNRIVLGQDDDGDEISSLAARHVSGADEIILAASRSGGPSSSLVRLLEAIGTGAPEEEVRKRFYSSMPEAETDARRQAYFRALKRAEGQGLVIRNGDWLDQNTVGRA